MEKRVIELDCRELVPCEPMERVLEATESLDKTEVIKMLNARVPLPLFPILQQRGFLFEVHEIDKTTVEILIWKEEE